MSDRVRLRPAHTAEELAQIYATPHDHSLWSDHRARVAATVAFANAVTGRIRGGAADLSCGDGAILRRIEVTGQRHYGDFASGYEFTGPIEATVEMIPAVDLFVCCETLEHLDDPDLVLKAVRSKTHALLLSTPVDAFEDTNPEHYWAWSRAGVEDILRGAGFTPHAYMELDFRPAGADYCYGTWVAR